MAIKLSGALAISEVSVEMLRVATYATNLNETPIRTMAGIPTGLISLAHLYGKSYFQGLWSGNSIASIWNGSIWVYQGIEVSGGSWRWYNNGTVGAWISTNSVTAAFTGDSLISNQAGYGTSGTSARAVNYYGGFVYGAWLTFTQGAGWSGGLSTASSVITQIKLETGSGLIRANGYYFGYVADGPWISLY